MAHRPRVQWRSALQPLISAHALRLYAGAGWLGIDPPGFVAQVVAFAFGLAAASFFPVIVLGIFTTRLNREGAIAGQNTNEAQLRARLTALSTPLSDAARMLSS